MCPRSALLWPVLGTEPVVEYGMDTAPEPAQPTPEDGARYLAEGQRLTFAHRGRPIELCVVPGRYVALLYNGVVRKERIYAGREPLYVWTNIELEWEEHHYVEVRYWPATDIVVATVNGTEIARWQDGKLADKPRGDS